MRRILVAKKALLLAVVIAGIIQNGEAQDAQIAAAARQMAQTQSAMAASIQLQMEHFHKLGNHTGRTTSGGFFVTDSSLQPSLDEPFAADCDAMSPLQIESLVTKAARAESVSADLLRAVIHQESDGRPCAVSSKGAMGLMQLMPGTAGDLGVEDALDPEANVLGGAKFLRKLLDRYAGDINRALGAYNAGPERVDETQGIPSFPETVNYVDSIMRALRPPAVQH